MAAEGEASLASPDRLDMAKFVAVIGATTGFVSRSLPWLLMLPVELVCLIVERDDGSTGSSLLLRLLLLWPPLLLLLPVVMHDVAAADAEEEEAAGLTPDA